MSDNHETTMTRRDFLKGSAAVATFATLAVLSGEMAPTSAADSEDNLQQRSLYSGGVEAMQGRPLLDPQRVEAGLNYLRRFDDPFLNLISGNINQALSQDSRLDFFPSWIDASPIRATESATNSYVHLQPTWKSDNNFLYQSTPGEQRQEKRALERVTAGMSVGTENSRLERSTFDGLRLAKEWIILTSAAAMAEGTYDFVTQNNPTTFSDLEGNPLTDPAKQKNAGVSFFMEVAGNPEGDIPRILDNLADLLLASRLMIGQVSQFPTAEPALNEARLLLERNNELRTSIFGLARAWLYRNDPTTTTLHPLPDPLLIRAVYGQPLNAGLNELQTRKENLRQTPERGRSIVVQRLANPEETVA